MDVRGRVSPQIVSRSEASADVSVNRLVSPEGMMFMRAEHRCVFLYCHVHTDGESRGHIGAPVQTLVSVGFIFLRHRVQKV